MTLMNAVTKVAIIIVISALFLGLIYQQIEISSLQTTHASPTPQPTNTQTENPTNQPTTNPTTTATSTPNPTPDQTTSPKYTEVPSKYITTNLNFSQQGSVNEGATYLLITGNITNTSPGFLANVGLHVTSYGYPFIQGGSETLIDTVVPLVNGTYPQDGDLTLTTLSPFQTIQLYIMVQPHYAYRTPNLYGIEITVVWADAPY